MKLAATIIKWICFAFNIVCLIVFILADTQVISITADIARNIMYAVYASWAIAIITKFITRKKKETESEEE